MKIIYQPISLWRRLVLWWRDIPRPIARVWTIKSSGGDFTSLQTANDSPFVRDGDTLLVPLGEVQFGPLSLNKRLGVIGSRDGD